MQLRVLLLCAVGSAAAYTVPQCFISRCTVRMSEDQPLRFEVCQNKYCQKKGAVKTLELFHTLAEGRTDVLVEKADMSHTEHGCFDECMMGPNVRVDGRRAKILPSETDSHRPQPPVSHQLTAHPTALF